MPSATNILRWLKSAALNSSTITIDTANDLLFVYDNSGNLVGTVTADQVGGGGGLPDPGTNNAVLTSDGAGGAVAESNLTWDGTDLSLLGDSFKLLLGSGSDASIYYDGSNLNINSAEVGSGNTVFSGGDVTHNPAATAQNEAFGLNALDALTTGSNNTAFGFNALTSMTTGGWNIAIGVDALKACQTGLTNVAIGAFALKLSTSTTGQNTAIGYNTQSKAVGATRNTSVGYQTLKAVTSGSNNVALGTNTLAAVTTGDRNFGLGSQSGGSLTTQDDNVCIGHNAFVFGGGNDNVAIGSTALGASAGSAYTNSNNNVAIGSNAGRSVQQDDSGNVMIGFEAGKNASVSNQLFIENSDSSTPLIYGEFDNDFVRINGHLEVGSVTTPTGTVTALAMFADNAGDPTPGSNTSGTYGKDVSGTVEQFAIDEAANATQLTSHPADAPAEMLDGFDYIPLISKTQRHEIGEIHWIHGEKNVDGQPWLIRESFDDYNRRMRLGRKAKLRQRRRPRRKRRELVYG